VAQDASLADSQCGLPMKRKLLTLEGTRLNFDRDDRKNEAVIQRVTRASVRVEGRTVGRIESGLLVLLVSRRAMERLTDVISPRRSVRSGFFLMSREDELLAVGYRGIGLAGVPVYAPRTNGEWSSPEL